MAAYMGHLSGPIMGKKDFIPTSGFTFDDTDINMSRIRQWRRYLAADSAIGVLGNLITTLMTCLLAYALLHPQNILPDE